MMIQGFEALLPEEFSFYECGTIRRCLKTTTERPIVLGFGLHVFLLGTSEKETLKFTLVFSFFGKLDPSQAKEVANSTAGKLLQKLGSRESLMISPPFSVSPEALGKIERHPVAKIKVDYEFLSKEKAEEIPFQVSILLKEEECSNSSAIC